MMPYHQNTKGWAEIENCRTEDSENIFSYFKKDLPHQR